MLLPLLALLSFPASAHYPHDIAFWVGISPGDDPKWVMTSLWRTEAWMLARTQNDADIDVRYVMPGEACEIHGGELLDEERLVLATDTVGLWTSDDAGTTYTQHEDIPSDAVLHQVAASPEIVDDGIAITVGLDGIWRTTDRGDSWTQVYEEEGIEFVDVDYSPEFVDDDRVCAGADSGPVYCSADEGATWEYVGEAQGGIWQLTVGEDDRIWLASAGKGIWISEDGGATWSRTGLDAGEYTTLRYFGEGLLLATTKEEAVWRSEDYGTTWNYHDESFQALDTTPGPNDGNYYYEFEEHPNGDIYLASWQGLVKSEDRGETWSHIETALMQTVKGVGFARSEEEGNPFAILASYGAGIEIVDGATSKARPLGHHCPWAFFRDLAVSPDFYDDGVAMPVGSGNVWVTETGGERWDQVGDVELIFPNRVAFAPDYLDDPFLLLASGSGERGEFAWSEDHGQTWSYGEPDTECSGPSKAVGFANSWADDGIAFAACGDTGAVYYTQDRAETFTLLTEVGDKVHATVGTDGGESLFIGAENGLWLSENFGEPELLAFEDEAVRAVAISPDWDAWPYVYVVVMSNGWYRSSDGGVTFEKLSAPSEDMAMAVAVSPDFGEDGTVAFTGYFGGYVSQDRGDSWNMLHSVEVMQTDYPSWVADPGWDEVIDSGASGQGYALTDKVGAEMTFSFRGVAVDIIAPTYADGGTFSVSLDGGESEEISLDGDPEDVVTVWSATDLADEWHELTVTAEEGLVRIDGAVVWRQDVEHADETFGDQYEDLVDDTGLPVDTGDTGPEPTDTGDTGPEPTDTGETGEPAADTGDTGPEPTDTGDGGSDGGCDCGGDDSKAALLLLPLPLAWGLRRGRRGRRRR